MSAEPIVVFGQSRPLPPPRPRPPRRAAFVAPLVVVLVGLLLGFGCARVVHGAEPDDAALVVAPLPTATPAPAYTATAEPVRVAPSSRGGREAVQALAEAHFPPLLVGWAVRTAGCETGFKWNLDAHDEGFDRRLGVYYSFWGPWQVDAISWSSKAWEMFGAPLSDPDTGAAMAAWIATNLGTGHWPVCSNGGSGGW